MKLNSNSKISSDLVVLIPYCLHHVDKYHKWMKSEELQKLTASNPLSLEEEYQMQKSWHDDEDKCTFIILDGEVYNSTGDEVLAMIGDTNVFLKSDNKRIAEIELMIAESNFRGKKRGWESVILMLRYGIENLNIEKYFAKISADNLPSIALFKKLQFQCDNPPDVFNELTFEAVVDDAWISWLNNQCTYKVLSYITENKGN